MFAMNESQNHVSRTRSTMGHARLYVLNHYLAKSCHHPSPIGCECSMTPLSLCSFQGRCHQGMGHPGSVTPLALPKLLEFLVQLLCICFGLALARFMSSPATPLTFIGAVPDAPVACPALFLHVTVSTTLEIFARTRLIGLIGRAKAKAR